jgi:hypothetical protein
LSSPPETEYVGYRLQSFERQLAELEMRAASSPERLAFFSRWAGRRTHQFYFDRFSKLRGEDAALSLLAEAEVTRDGHRGAAHNYLTHGLHSYKGKFFPQVVRSLLNSVGLAAPAEVVDPFVGSGTTTLEASLMGLSGYGIDRNPLAVLIARTKSSALALEPPVVRDGTRAILAALDAAPEAELPNRAYLERWFPPANLRTVARILGAVEAAETPAAMRDLARVTLSSLLRGWSLQEPSQLRIFRRRSAPGAAALADRFTSDLHDASRAVALGRRLLHELGIAPGPVRIVEGDAREAAAWGDGRFDALVTSPPYATALPYIDTDRLSIYTLGLDAVSERAPLEWSMIGNREIRKGQRRELEERLAANDAGLPAEVLDDILRIRARNEAVGVGFRRENLPTLLYRYFADMKAVLERAAETLLPRALCAIVVGDSFTLAGDERFRIRTADFLCAIAGELGFTLDERIEMGGQAAYLPHQRNGIPGEEILRLRAPLPR